MAGQTQIHQVLMNLCTNAAHAMEAGSRQLAVTLELLLIDKKTVAPGDDLAPGCYLQLSVRDTGTGMEKAMVIVRGPLSGRLEIHLSLGHQHFPLFQDHDDGQMPIGTFLDASRFG